MLDTTGDLWPCHRWDGADFDTGGARAWVLGNIFEPDWRHDDHRRHLARGEAGDWSFACDACRVRRFCAGGCPAANVTATGSMTRVNSRACRTMEILYRCALRAQRVLAERRNPLFLEAFYGATRERTSA